VSDIIFVENEKKDKLKGVHISLHLKNIFVEGEMDEFSVTEYSSVTAAYDNISKLYKLNDFII